MLSTDAPPIGQSVAFPRIDRFFPECWCATVEAVARHRFGVADFGKVYGHHTFKLDKPPGALAFRENGVELDLWFHRTPLGPTELADAMRELYGVEARHHAYSSYEPYWRHCEQSLRQGIPVVTDFDLGFIRGRREYGKVFSSHVVALHGLDSASGALLAAEQMLGSIRIEASDFNACHARKLGAGASLSVWELGLDAAGGRPLGWHDLATRAQANSRNLSSNESTLGLAALRSFRDELAGYLDSANFGERPFSVPGLWVFSHERHITRKWLAEVARSCQLVEHPCVQALDATLGRLFTAWLSTDYLIEKCLMAQAGKALRSLPTYLDRLFVDEALAAEQWHELETIAEGHGARAGA